MERHQIPAARFVVCEDLSAALDAVSGATFGFPVVVKADGLAEAAVRAAMVDQQFGAAGARLVIEECLVGPEVSMFYLLDGATAVPLGSAQDHKRIWDDDRGPNTGGMGAFAPSPLVSAELERYVMDRVVRPVLDGHRAEGDPYVGFLYVSLMLTATGPKVIEFNVRFGDPEAQAVMPLLEAPFARLLLSAATGALASDRGVLGQQKTVGVVLASRGYPATAESGRPIAGVDLASAVPGVAVFHAGTKMQGDQLVTAGGRVLTVVGKGATFEHAKAAAYRAVEMIHFDGMQYRRDIGRKAIDGGTWQWTF
jgi:phosphoribosylamine--glycine ligase